MKILYLDFINIIEEIIEEMSNLEQNNFENDLKEWVLELNKYVKYNVKLFELKSEYISQLSNPKMSSKLTGKCDFSFCSVESMYQIVEDDFKDVDYIKSNIVSFLENEGNIRVGIYLSYNEKIEYFLLSSYEENQEYYKVCGENMYDDVVYVLYYIVRYPMLDKDGYYSLSGMSGFNKDEFFKKYNIDIWKQPYLL
jgi:hypothetical protein